MPCPCMQVIYDIITFFFNLNDINPSKLYLPTYLKETHVPCLNPLPIFPSSKIKLCILLLLEATPPEQSSTSSGTNPAASESP